MTSLITLFFSVAFALPLSEFEALKLKSKRLTTDCVDLRGQNETQRAISKKLSQSVHAYVGQHLTKQDREKSILGAIAGVGTDATHAVLIFYGGPTSGTNLADSAWRSEHRERLEQLVRMWQRAEPLTRLPILIRFDDECDVPVADWK